MSKRSSLENIHLRNAILILYTLNSMAVIDRIDFFFFKKLSFQNQCEAVSPQTLTLAAK